MALVKQLRKISLERDSNHLETDCTYCVVTENGQKLLQLDTYGSRKREIPGKKSQSIRFSPRAIAQLRAIIDAELL